MKYVAPKRLNKGDKVAIIAPSSPFVPHEVVEGLDILREAGLKPVFGPNVKNLRTSRVVAGTREQRTEELMWAFSDPSIKGIFVSTGGYGSAGCLPGLDYEVIRKTRKSLLGFSDITALNNGILKGAGLISINGQTLSIRVDEGGAKRESDSNSLEIAVELMMSDEDWGVRPFEVNNKFSRCVSPGKARGPAIGTNINTFCTLIGTPHMPDYKGTILFLEDTHEDGEEIARELLHLDLAGILDDVAGVVIGEFAEVPKKTDARVPDVDDVVLDFFGKRGVPCSYGYSFSHGMYTVPVPIGADTELDAETGEVTFHFRMG